ncbi:MAG: choice-of-anchor tandem repeat GloVer-containing protein, partial [Capsulimonadaceae bacterium]
GSDGNFYGTTYFGGSTRGDNGSNGLGAAFKITPSGSVTILHSFRDGSVTNDGANPYAGLIQGSDGNFYGTTVDGGSTYGSGLFGNGDGTVIKMTPSGSVTILHSFGDGSVLNDGDNPYAGLIQASNGIFYGATKIGGSAGPGTVFDLALAPAVPAGLAAVAGNAQITLSWNPAAFAISYNVFRGTTSGGESGTAIATDVTSTGYTDTGLTNGVQYFYKVAAVDGAGTSAPSSEASATPEPLPAAPTGLTATGGNALVGLSWNASLGATSYNVYRATASGAEGSTTVGTTTGTAFTSTGLTNGIKYFFKVAAVSGGGTSAQSTEVSATPEPPIPAAPAGLTATAGNAQVSLTWSASAGSTSYNVYRATTSGAEGSIAVGTAIGTSYTDTGLTNGVKYYYKVAAVDGGGTSAQSSEASATPEGAATSLSGTVTSSVEVEPIAGATVTLTPPAGSGLTVLTTSTISNGQYMFSNIATGSETTASWTLEVVAAGYNTYVGTVSITAGTAETQNVSLQPTTVGAAHVLWSNGNGSLSLWNYNPATGAYTQNSYGPFANWTPTAVADGPDGMTRVLWVSTTGAAAIWSVNGTTGVYTQYGFGPFPGWAASAVSVSPSNVTHVLWSTSGSASIWNYNTATGAYTQNAFGPFAGWSAKTIADGPDGLTRFLWVSSSGTASIWNLNTATGAFTQNSFGPYPSWTACAVSVNAANTTHVLWTGAGAASLWNYSPSTGAFTQNDYGPFPGWTATSITDGPDGNTQFLWDSTSGSSSIWDLNNSTGAYTQNSFGPFPGWTATAVSAYP